MTNPYTNPIQHLINTNGRHPITIGDPGLPNAISLALHPTESSLTAGRADDYPTPAQTLDILKALYPLTTAIATSTRCGRSSHFPTIGRTKKGQETRHYKPTIYITEFHWREQS